MDQTSAHPRAAEDRLVFFALALTWPIYLIGGLFVLGPVLAVILTVILGGRVYFSDSSLGQRSFQKPSAGVWVWALGMVTMLVALEVGHALQQLSPGQTVKSTIGWAKGWGLFVLFPMAGACLNIRLETVLRAAGYVALGTLFLIPVLVAAPFMGMPEVIYISPLKAVGGPGPEFFTVQLYSLEPVDGSYRWRFFAPWSPAAGLVGNMYLIFALADKRLFWKGIGVFSAVAVIVLSKSRLALAVALIIWPTVMLLSQTRRPILWFATAASLLGIMPYIQTLQNIFGATLESVATMRAASTQVRETLGEIALDRWWTEAPVWGHGIVERGPHTVEYMPIGSHHTWYGLLFVKGAVGAIALAIPLIWSLIEFAWLTICRSRTGQIALAMTLLMSLYTIGENLEILAYLMWPGLLVMGMAMRDVREIKTKT